MQQAVEALNYRINIESQSLAMCPPDRPDIIIHQQTIEELSKAIHLIQASIDMCHCPPVEPGFNAALHDLGHSMSVHKHLETALYGTPKGSYHSLCIVELEQAIKIITSSLNKDRPDTNTFIGYGLTRRGECGHEWPIQHRDQPSHCPVCNP